jgi:molecular chaperone DnaK (HSP70)
MSTRFSLGIDLGTTNSAIALTDLESDHTEVIEVTQIIGPNQIGEKPTLSSALYIPHRDEFPENSWCRRSHYPKASETIAGHFARDHGALVPDRLITSAKSWLSNPHIDPRRQSLPFFRAHAAEKPGELDPRLHHTRVQFNRIAQ